MRSDIRRAYTIPGKRNNRSNLLRQAAAAAWVGDPAIYPLGRIGRRQAQGFSIVLGEAPAIEAQIAGLKAGREQERHGQQANRVNPK
jgi:hypothetical protein